MYREIDSSSPLIIQEDSIIFDDGNVEELEITVQSGVTLRYLILPSAASNNTRTFHIQSGATFIGAGVYYHANMVQKMSVIIDGQDIHASLNLLALVRDHAQISVDGIGRVEQGSSNVHLRVDQTNVLLGHGGIVRARPILQIETDSIE